MDTSDALAGTAALAERLVPRLLRFVETLEGEAAVFAPDALFDLNVPRWRLQILGRRPFAAWLGEEAPQGYQVLDHQVTRTATGFVVELDAEFRGRRGEPLYTRHLWVCRVTGDRIAGVTVYSTGDWDAETRRSHAARAPMIR